MIGCAHMNAPFSQLHLLLLLHKPSKTHHHSSALTDGINKLQQATSHLGDLVSEISDTIEDIKKVK